MAVLLLACYIGAFLAFRWDPVQLLILTSFDRLELHLIPAILVAAGIALDPAAARARRGAERRRIDADS